MRARYLLGLILLILGIGYLLEQVAVIKSFGAILAIWWPLLIVLVGLNQLIRAPRRPWGALLIILIGAALQLSKLGLLPKNLWPLVGAVLLIAFGLWLLMPRRHRKSTTGTVNIERSQDRLNESVSFGAVHYQDDSSQFRGGRVSASFGEFVLDLRSARLAPEGADMELSASFGSINVIVPDDWTVVSHGSPSFGACTNKARNIGPVVAGTPALRVKCTASFGSVEITTA